MNTQQVKIYDEVSLLKSVAPNCWEVHECFSEETLEWLKSIIANEGNIFRAERLHRRLMLEPGADYDRLQEIGRAIIPQLNAVTGENLNLMISKFWLDLPEFGCQMHSDSEEIIVSYQVYISAYDNPEHPIHGIEFHHVDPPYEVPINQNWGYINLNTDLKLHQVQSGTGVRTSVIFQYNRV